MRKNMLKRILSIFILSLCLCCFVKVDTKATTYNYVDPDSELRAAWITPITNSVVNYSSESQFKSNMNGVLDNLEASNLNTLIFHVRPYNDALYDSDINPINNGWKTVNFNVFDPLEWLIEECHSRGIEFHAWMNPYRVTNGGATSAATVAANYTNYPLNSASDADNILVYNNKAILNPAKQEVRDHVVNTVIEFVSRYDADAVHFDDYFYFGMEANGATSGTTTILDEADNDLYIDFCDNFGSLSSDLKEEYTYYRSTYSATNALHKADWRRVQCNLFFKQLKASMDTFNQTNGKYIQVGVAPTGIYKNGDGVVTYDSNGWPVTTGSATSGQTHYSSYLFADTVYWCCKNWIDYIMPQSYWATNHPSAGYYNVMGWWDKVVKNLDVNLYSGIGIYMAENSSSRNWYSDMDELYNQLDHITTLENVDGASFYSYDYFAKKYTDPSSNSGKQASHLGVNVWKKVVVQPELKSMTPVNLGIVPNFAVSEKTLTWDKLTNAKFYAIYRSSGELTFAASELVDIVGGSSETFEWTDGENGNYTYGIRALSYTNTLGTKTLPNTKYGVEIQEGASIRTTGERQGLKFTANVETLTDVLEHGFYIALGEHTTNDMVTAINASEELISGNKLVKKEITGSGLAFHAVVYNITEEYYNQDISAIAYVKYYNNKTSKYVYEFSEVLTRNIAEVAVDAYQGGDRTDFVTNIYNKVSAVKELVTVGSINLEVYNAGLFDANYYNSYVYLKKGYASAVNWIGIFLNEVENGKYIVVDYKISGNNASISECDYCIYVYVSNTTDYNNVLNLGVQIGDIVTFSSDISSLVDNTVIDITANVGRYEN